MLSHVNSASDQPTTEQSTDHDAEHGDAASSPVRIVTVCSHNRTRSVMSMAMLQAGFDAQLGPGRVTVESLGFGPEGIEAIPAAVEAMRDRELDVTGHRSRKVTSERIRDADLVLTAERDHVVRIAGESPDTYRRSFTLPEFCQRVSNDPVADGRPLRAWMSELSDGRSAGEYLRGDVPEVADPTGEPKRSFDAAVRGIEEMCDTVVVVLSRSL